LTFSVTGIGIRSVGDLGDDEQLRAVSCEL
jgi:hypothetical protein